MIRLMLVDDDPTLLSAAKYLLERQGDISVETVSSPGDALDQIRATSPDVVISDYLMPGLDGVSLLRELNASGFFIPFILLTGKSSETIAIDALNAGADYYIKKSGDSGLLIGELLEKVRDLVRERDNQERQAALIDRYRSIIDHQAECIIRFSPDGKYTFLNRSFCDYFSLPYDDLIGEDMVHKFPSEDLPLLKDHFSSLTLENPSGSIEHRVIKPDGDIRWHYCNNHAIFNQFNQIIEYQSVARDITERKRAEEALRQVNRKLHLLNCITRHDVLNQLIILTGYLELSRQHVGDDIMLDYIKKEELTAEKIRAKIAFTRDFQDVGVKDPSWLQPVRIVSHIPDQMEMGTISWQVDIGSFEVYADPLIEKVFSNLVENSFQHAGPSFSQIRWHTFKEGDALHLVYEDNGRGIPYEEKSRIFEPGYGSHNGYGLFLAREVLSITGLEITECGVPGAGAYFKITVPKGFFRNTGFEPSGNLSLNLERPLTHSGSTGPHRTDE